MSTEEDTDDTLPLRELRRIAGGSCRDCRTRFTAREAVANIALGFKNAPRCFACLANRLDRAPQDLLQQVTNYVHRRDCYLRAWQEADLMEQQGTSIRPSEPDEEPTAVEPEDTVWSAGDMGCGEPVMQLRIRLNNLPPGTVFTVRATDPAAPEDIPSWCRLTGHALVSAEHPVYRIRRRES